MASILNDIDPTDYQQMIERYGVPVTANFEADFLDFECELVRRSSTKGRQHDITCFIPKDNGYVTIQKHDYANTGIYRAPSGGAKCGETIIEAAKREMLEETGYEVELRNFVLDLRLDVKCSEGRIPWRSLVFIADIIDGKMEPKDTYEIFDVRITPREMLLGEIIELMENSGWGGFGYRAFLTKLFFSTVDEMGIELP